MEGRLVHGDLHDPRRERLIAPAASRNLLGACALWAAVATGCGGGYHTGSYALQGQGVPIQSYPTQVACCDPGVSCSPCGHVHAGRELSAANEATNLTNLKVKWFSNYKATHDDTTTVPYVPMIFGHSNVNGTELAQAKSSTNTSGWLLGFNEPNNGALGGSAMTVAQALSDWPSLEATGLKLCSPATGTPQTASGPHDSTDWMSDFAAGDANRNGIADDGGYVPRFDAVCLHYYTTSFAAPATAASSLSTIISSIAVKYHKPTLITELGAIGFSGSDPAAWSYPTAPQAIGLAQALVPMLRGRPADVLGWSWYPNAAMADLVTDAPNYANITMSNLDGTLTSLGTTYLGL